MLLLRRLKRKQEPLLLTEVLTLPIFKESFVTHPRLLLPYYVYLLAFTTYFIVSEILWLLS